MVVPAVTRWLARVVANKSLVYDTVDVDKLDSRRRGFEVGPNTTLQATTLELLVHVPQLVSSHKQQCACFERLVSTSDPQPEDTHHLTEIGGSPLVRRVERRLGLRLGARSKEDKRVVRRCPLAALVLDTNTVREVQGLELFQFKLVSVDTFPHTNLAGGLTYKRHEWGAQGERLPSAPVGSGRNCDKPCRPAQASK